MCTTEVKSDRLQDKYYKIDHKSGLTIYVYPKRDYVSTYGICAVNFGSVNCDFMYNGERITLPDGTAHYMEHKMFDGFTELSSYSNAYTTFDKTAYLFSCTQGYEKCLQKLLELMQNPSFTEESVEKERGIIAQEIKMYEDDPYSRAIYNLLEALYYNSPVKKRVAGTVDSIMQITPQTLYTCYNSFYSLENMVLCVAGNVDVGTVCEIADKVLEKSVDKTAVKAENLKTDEPYEVKARYIEEECSLSMPLFYIGFKQGNPEDKITEKDLAETDIMMFLLSSNTSRLYKQLTDEELINSTFGYEYLYGDGYSMIMFSGETKDPARTSDMIRNAIVDMKNNGISTAELEIAKKAIYGSEIESFNSTERIGNAMVDFAMGKLNVFDYLDAIADVTSTGVYEKLNKLFDVNNYSLSVVLPKKEE